jgi:two-component sensor histidine kinase
MNVRLDVEGDLKMPGDVQTAYYYIAQEAFNNIVKHSRAHQVDVRVASTPDTVTLTIRDDGRGFDTDQVPATSLGWGSCASAQVQSARRCKLTAPRSGNNRHDDVVRGKRKARGTA